MWKSLHPAWQFDQHFTKFSRKVCTVVVSDPEHDVKHASIHRRLGHMRLPAHVTTEEVQELHVILQHYESSLRACNRYVRDFQLACELPRAQVEQSRLIIHADPHRAANQGEHAGRYNRA